MNLFANLYRAFYSRTFYQAVAKAQLSLGLFFLLLASLVSAVLWSVQLVKAWPVLDHKVAWVIDTMPTITWTAEGIEIDRQSPYVMTEPESGVTITFDTRTDILSPDAMRQLRGQTTFFITAKKLYDLQAVQDGVSLGVINLDYSRDLPEENRGEALVIDRELIRKIFLLATRVALIAGPVFMVLLGWVSEFMLSVFFCLLAMVFNQRREKKLDYASLLNLTIFARTPGWVLGWMTPAPFWATSLLTVFYLYFAVRLSEEGRSSVLPGS